MSAISATLPPGRSTGIKKGVHFENEYVIHTARISSSYGLTQAPSNVSGQGPNDDHDTCAEPSLATIDDDDPWDKKTILSLDGGGIRGYTSLLILQRLMKEIGKLERESDSGAISSAYSPLVHCLPDETLAALSSGTKPVPEYLPCHYFDYVGGASTGGLIAIMLGRLRMSVDEAIQEYKELSANVFEKPTSRLKRFLTKYDSTARREKLKGQFDALKSTRPSPQEEGNQFKSDRDRCRTIVCSIKSSENNNFQTPFLFRSYDRKMSCSTPFERNPGDLNTFAIWEVARATSAAPSYFKSIRLFQARYYDAAVNLNNPSWEVLNEVNLLAEKPQDAIDLLCSIGGGNTKANNPKINFGKDSLLQDLTDISDVVHNRVKYESELQLFDYYRFDVKEGLQEVRMNEWKPKPSGSITLKRIQEATSNYLEHKDVSYLIQECAKRLVEKRAQRAQTMRWERFATGTRYKCPLDDCSISKTHRFNTRNDLMDHLRMQHDQAPPDADHYQLIQNLLDRGRTGDD
ncbi:MAG: hypothetical protein ASARMPRED_000388 [Alectoria sarmentosa]|nr:MAG: hypothetical protein ASARMPRED_000388 [Alectoria sarmentosa]